MKKINITLILAMLACEYQSALAQDDAFSPNEIAPLRSELDPRKEIEQDLKKEKKEAPIVIETPAEPEKKEQELEVYSYDEDLKKTVKPFILKKIIFEDIHSFEAKDFEDMHKEYIGTEVDANKIAEISALVHQFYQNNGFLLTHCYAPLDNNFKDGVLRVKIINAGFRKVHLLGGGEVTELVKEYQKKIINTYPVTKKSVVRYKKLIDLLPGYEIKLMKIVPLSAKDRKSHREFADLIIVAQKISNKVSLKLDNQIRKRLGDYKATATIEMYSPFKKGEEIHLVYTTSSKSKAYKSLGLTYAQPINTEGTVLKAITSYTQSNNTVVSARSSRMRSPHDDISTNLAVQLSHPFILENKFTVTGTIGLDYQKYTRYQPIGKVADDLDSELSTSIITRYDDKFKGINYAVLSYGKGLPGSKYEAFNGYPASPIRKNYNKFSSYLFRWQPIYDMWFASASLYGQYSNSPLSTARKFSIGGGANVRGYGDRFISSSKGVAGTLELHYYWRVAHNYVRLIDLYGFYDQGKISPNGSAEKKLLGANSGSLSSFGYGAQATLAGNLKAKIEAGYALKNLAATQGDCEIKKGKRTAVFSLEHVVEW